MAGGRQGGGVSTVGVRSTKRAIKDRVCGQMSSYNACMKGLFQILSRSILGAYSIGWYGAKDIVFGKV